MTEREAHVRLKEALARAGSLLIEGSKTVLDTETSEQMRAEGEWARRLGLLPDAECAERPIAALAALKACAEALRDADALIGEFIARQYDEEYDPSAKFQHWHRRAWAALALPAVVAALPPLGQGDERAPDEFRERPLVQALHDALALADVPERKQDEEWRRRYDALVAISEAANANHPPAPHAADALARESERALLLAVARAANRVCEVGCGCESVGQEYDDAAQADTQLLVALTALAAAHPDLLTPDPPGTRHPPWRARAHGERMSEPDEEPLEVLVIGGRLVITIGVKTLACAVTHGVTDPLAAAKAIHAELCHEDEGTTLVHKLLDRAAFDAYENGGEGFA